MEERRAHSMPQEMKDALAKKRIESEISSKIREANQKPEKVLYIPKNNPVVLPEDFTGRDLKKVIRYYKGRRR